MRLDTANLYAIDALLHHACRKSHGLERVMSELCHMGCTGGRSGCIHLWVLTLLYCILTHLVPRCGGLEGRVVVVLDAGREHSRRGIWSVGHEADVVLGLLLLGRLLLGGVKVGGVDGHLGELGDVLLWTQHVGGMTDVHGDWRGDGTRGRRAKKAGRGRERGEHGARAERARCNGGGNGRVRGTEGAASEGRSRRRSSLSARTTAGRGVASKEYMINGKNKSKI